MLIFCGFKYVNSMKQGLKRFLILGMLAVPACAMASMPGDSVGVKVVNGKAYVLYKLAKGDNLGRISREYGVSVASLEELNSIQAANIQAGQVLMVPSRNPNAGGSLKNVATTTTKPVEVAKPAPQNPKSAADRKQHVVEKGETLYAVSRKHSVSVDQIKQWNHLTADGLKEGQKLWVSGELAAQPVAVKVEDKPKLVEVKPVVTDKPVVVKAVDVPKPVVVKTVDTPKSIESVTASADGGTQPKIKSSGGIHVVKPGETLFGIARTYGMDVSELRKINRLEDASIQEGQALRVKADSQANSNQGTGLADAFVQTEDTTPKLEAFPDLKVLTAPTTTSVPSAAVVTVYKDKSTGKSFKRVEETGKVGGIEDFSTDQTRFYAFHRYLPVGSYIRVDYPAKGQSILVEVISKLPEKDPYAVRLSAKCLEYLMVREAGAEVRLRYVIPFAE
jgi:LysM repeat protein